MLNFTMVAQIMVLINPFSTIIFLFAINERGLPVRRLAGGAILIAFSVAMCWAICGHFLLALFHVSLDSFRLAGGMVLLLSGIETVRRRDDQRTNTGDLDSLMAILAMPTMTGPATISYVTLLAKEIGVLPSIVNLSVAFALIAVIVGLFIIFMARIKVRIINIAARVFGLFLTAVAVEMMARGLKGLLVVSAR